MRPRAPAATRRKVGYGYLYEGAPYSNLAPKDSIKTFWRGGFRTPAEIETYDTPFDFENKVSHQSAFVNDTWNIKRFSFNGGLRFDSFLPYYDQFPYGLGVSTSVRVTKGEPYGRTLNTTGLTQGAITLTVEPQGTFFYDTVALVDLRLSKTVTVKGRSKIEGLLDLFNVNNSPAVLSRNNQTGAAFGSVLTTVNPRIARLGIRWTF